MTDKLQNHSTAPKMYWAILSHLLYSKKIPALPSLLVDGKIVSDFCEKANLFNIFFSSICTPIQNISISSPFLYMYRTNARTTLFHVTKENMLLIIKTSDLCKAHGSNNILIKWLRFVVSQSFLNNRWKKGNSQTYGKNQM